MKFDLVKFAYGFRSSKRIVILGASGSGKTFFANLLTRGISNRARIPVLIVDTKREIKFRRTPQITHEWVNAITPTKRKIQSIRLNNEIIADYRVAEFAAAICWTVQNCCLYVEEIVELVGKNSVQFPQTNPLLYKILQQGRERNCSLICATQRAAQLNLSFVDEATDIFIFQINSREQKFVEDNFRLPKNSLNFSGKPQFGFYHIAAGRDPVFFNPIPNSTNWHELKSEPYIPE